MSVASDLQVAFAEKSMTCPVLLGVQSTRGFLDRAGALQKIGGVEMQAMTQVLYVQVGSLAVVRGGELVIGALGADSAVGGTRYRINDYEAIEDGEIIAIAIAGGTA